MKYQYHVMARPNQGDELLHRGSFVGRLDAVEVADRLVERDYWWSAHVSNNRRHVVYSVFKEPVKVEWNGETLPLRRDRSLIELKFPAAFRYLYHKEDDEFERAVADFAARGVPLRRALTIREVREIFHNVDLNAADTFSAAPF